MSERTYVLGGETRKRTLFAGVSGRQVAVLVLLVILWLLVLMAFRTVWTLLGGVVMLGAGWLLMQRRTALGESWIGAATDRAAFKAGTQKGADRPDFVPGETLPPEVGEVRVLAYAPPTAPKAPMAIIHHKDHDRRSWGTGHLTATFEIQGAGDGLLPTRQINQAGHLFERLLGGLASAEIPVDQLDVATRVLPVHPGAYQEHMADLVVPDAPARLRASMNELASFAAGNSEEYRSFVTLRIPLQHLQATASIGQGALGLEEVCAETFNVLGDVVRRVDTAGYRLRAVLGPRRLGALVRHLHDPDHSMDSLDGIESAKDGWNYLRYKGATHARIEGTVQDWYHAVAHVPRDAWPAQAVNSRWLEHLVTQVSPATIRTVVSQFRLVPKVRAQEIAKVNLTLDTADKSKQQKRKQVSTGVTEASMSASQRTLKDLITPVVGGVYPSVRVMVSAPDVEGLAAARKRVVACAEDGGITRLDWADYQHHKAMITCLPMARGVRA